ncbi:zinc ribbon domain-containing protein [Bengtsoniella intestinalis]|uniref:zinc ribbon domain-containing protein n=1 Tax=Bengtsoniella intestinalis TaxID=3073143 RepID=UPI00391F2DEB
MANGRFSGYLVCADCGHNLHFHFNQRNKDIKYFNCSNYNSSRGTCSSTHYIRVDFLEQVVLAEIRRLTQFASRYEETFVQAMMGYSQKMAQQAYQQKEKELAGLLSREKELDVLVERLYEDNVIGKITDDRFHRMSSRYEEEQAGIREQTKKLRAELQHNESRSMTTAVPHGGAKIHQS